MRSQIVTSSWGGRQHATVVFTEQGVAMLSSAIRSPRAIRVNVEIMRAFVRLRNLLHEHRELARRIGELEKKQDTQIKAVMDVIRGLMETSEEPKEQIGFRSS